MSLPWCACGGSIVGMICNAALPRWNHNTAHTLCMYDSTQDCQTHYRDERKTILFSRTTHFTICGNWYISRTYRLNKTICHWVLFDFGDIIIHFILKAFSCIMVNQGGKIDRWNYPPRDGKKMVYLSPKSLTRPPSSPIFRTQLLKAKDRFFKENNPNFQLFETKSSLF